MSNRNQLRAGVYLSYINLALGTLIPFFYTPLMLRLLGDAEYGLYSLSHSVIGYLSLLSFGLGGTVIRYISIYRTKDEKNNVEAAFGFFICVYAILAGIVLISGFVLSDYTNEIFHRGLTDTEINKIRILMRIMAANTALSFPISVFTSIEIAYERYFFRRILEIIYTVSIPLVNLISLYMGFASVGMAVGSLIMQFILAPISMMYCFNRIGIRPRLKILPKMLVIEMLGFSTFIFLGTIVDMLFWSTDKVILGMLTNTTAVAVYNIGSTFNGMMTNLSTSISGVLTPKITGMIVEDRSLEELSELFIRVGRLQYIVVALILSGFIVFGRSFVVLWAGETYRNAYWIALLTMIPLSIPLIQNTGLSIVIAQNKHRFRSYIYFVIAVVNVISTYYVVPFMGGIGAALCSCISYFVGQGIIMNVYYSKVTRLNILSFWINILKMSIIPFILMSFGLFLSFLGCFDGLITFLVGVIVYSILYVILMFKCGMNKYEKDIFKDLVNKALLIVNNRSTR